eukprot:9179097-Lingulodinium_polyedra.AAC.1
MGRGGAEGVCELVPRMANVPVDVVPVEVTIGSCGLGDGLERGEEVQLARPRPEALSSIEG